MLSLRTAIDSDQGIQHASDRRVYPDDRILDYNKEVRLLSDTRQRLLLPFWEGSWICDLRATGASIRSIAQTMVRAPSTISQELRSN